MSKRKCNNGWLSCLGPGNGQREPGVCSQCQARRKQQQLDDNGTMLEAVHEESALLEISAQAAGVIGSNPYDGVED